MRLPIEPSRSKQLETSPRIDVAPTDSFSTRVVNGFLARVSRSTNDDLVLHPVIRIEGESSAKLVVASNRAVLRSEHDVPAHDLGPRPREAPCRDD